MIIRPIKHDDLQPIAHIIDAIVFYQNYGVQGQSVASTLKQILNQENHTILVAEIEHQPIGFAWFMHKAAFDRSNYLRLLAIKPSHQKMGIGQQLMKHGESQLIQPHGLCLLVTSDNTPARRFYTHLGYTHIGTLPNYVQHGRDECLYFKSPTSI